MAPKLIFGLSLSLFLSANLMAEDLMVQSISQGACWYEQGELLKVVSFNDHETLSIEREGIEHAVADLLEAKNKTKFSSELALHCGGYGASFVVKTEYQGLPACLWLKMAKGKLQVRSLGGLEETKGELCDGYKWGELIVGLKSPGQKDLLSGESLQSVVQQVVMVNGTMAKVILRPEYRGKEAEAMAELKKQVEAKYVELNYYQHPVGEVAGLK